MPVSSGSSSSMVPSDASVVRDYPQQLIRIILVFCLGFGTYDDFIIKNSPTAANMSLNHIVEYAHRTLWNCQRASNDIKDTLEFVFIRNPWIGCLVILSFAFAFAIDFLALQACTCSAIGAQISAAGEICINLFRLGIDITISHAVKLVKAAPVAASFVVPPTFFRCLPTARKT